MSRFVRIFLAASALISTTFLMLFPFSQTGVQSPAIPDSILHIIIFIVCGICVLNLKARQIYSLLFLVIFAISVESGQAAVPSRSVEIKDVFCNFYGLFIAFCAVNLTRYIKERRIRSLPSHTTGS